MSSIFMQCHCQVDVMNLKFVVEKQIYHY